MPIGRPVSRSNSRRIAKRARWSSALPWLKLRRNTSTPARNSSRTMCAAELAGPRVATILALRVLRKFMLWGPLDEYRAKIIDVGEGRPGNDRTPQSREQSMRVIVGKNLPGAKTSAKGARQQVWRHVAAGNFLLTVDAVRVARQRMDARMTAERYGERQQIFDIAPASSAAAHGHSRLAPRKQDTRGRYRLVVFGDLHGNRSQDFAHVARLAFDGVAQDICREPRAARDCGSGFQRHLRRRDDAHCRARQPRVTGLDRFTASAFQHLPGGRRQLDT